MTGADAGTAVVMSNETTGPTAADLGWEDLLRELAHLHETRHETFLHGSAAALRHHSQRTAELEQEYLRRHPGREVEDGRLRAGRRHD